MVVKTYSAALNGTEVTPVVVEVNLTPGMGFTISGMGDMAVKESRDRIVSAILHNGFYLTTDKSITANLAPADLRKEGSGFDLPLAVVVMRLNENFVPLAASSTDEILGEKPTDILGETMMVGELGLDGRLMPIRGALPIAIAARKHGFRNLIVPRQNEREAAVVDKLHVYGMDALIDVVDFVSGRRDFTPVEVDTRAEFYAHQYSFELDYADVRGQENVRRALEVAAAGGHNIIMIGPPGSGKSMMAKRLPSILPPLTLRESLETTQIHSIAGKTGRDTSLIAQRPFRAPHHTISEVALVGGGTNPQPGEISLAHNGVLFADELPEFNRTTLEVLRQPLEDRKITISRAKYTIEYPCSFMFVASMNPCPCGYYGDRTHTCVCTPGQISRYMNRISGPLLDRIDLQVEIQAISFDEISQHAPGESSEKIRERVIAARAIQERRYASFEGIHCNAQMTDKLIHEFAEPDAEGLELLRHAMQKLNLSARAYSRILKVARTIADLEGSAAVTSAHLGEAISYRKLDRADYADKVW